MATRTSTSLSRVGLLKRGVPACGVAVFLNATLRGLTCAWFNIDRYSPEHLFFSINAQWIICCKIPRELESGETFLFLRILGTYHPTQLLCRHKAIVAIITKPHESLQHILGGEPFVHVRCVEQGERNVIIRSHRARFASAWAPNVLPAQVPIIQGMPFFPPLFLSFFLSEFALTF